MTLTTVLFAGGESRRMGMDKATIPYRNRLLWSRQICVLRELQPERIQISARSRPAWASTEIESVLDEPPSRGPLSGLVAAFRDLRTTHLLALAIDLPEMTSEHLKKLLALTQPGVGVIPFGGRRFEPLAAIYPAGAAALAEEELADNRLSLQSLAQRLSGERMALIYSLSEEELRLYHNVNSPEDLQRMGRYIGSNIDLHNVQ